MTSTVPPPTRAPFDRSPAPTPSLGRAGSDDRLAVSAPAATAPPPGPRSDSAGATGGSASPTRSLGGRRLAVMVLAWAAVTVAGVLLVLYQVGPLVQQRHQRSAMREFRADLVESANASFGLPGATAPTLAPAPGSPVAVLDSADLALRQVVVEGAGAGRTARAPGHVTGTAGLGQPGNAVVVGRRSLSGGPFGSIDELDVGDRLLVTTTQGQSVYVVGHVATHRLVDGSSNAVPAVGGVGTTADVEGTEAGAAGADDEGVAAEPLVPSGALTIDDLYGPTDDDRLTLITSASSNPFSSASAQVVVATMEGTPFSPTPQGGRTTDGEGRQADGGASAGVLLAVLAYAAAVAAAVVAYRRVAWRGAYLLTAPLLVATTIVLAEQLQRLLPAWS